jgi:hypothetical protein
LHDLFVDVHAVRLSVRQQEESNLSGGGWMGAVRKGSI